MHAAGFIQGCSAVHQSGRYSARGGHAAWEQNQQGPLDVQRKQVYEQPLPEFGKLQCADKLAFSAAAMLFGELSGIDRTDFGICLGTVYGSLSTDIRYMESLVAGYPRPAYFSATLPSSPVAEVAIRFGIKGPNRVVCGGACPGLSALDCAFGILRKNKAPAALVMAINALEAADRSSALIGPAQFTEPYAYALLISAGRWEKGLNRRFVFEGEFHDRGMTLAGDESYFLDMILAIILRRQCRIAVESAGFEGSLSIEKD